MRALAFKKDHERVCHGHDRTVHHELVAQNDLEEKYDLGTELVWRDAGDFSLFSEHLRLIFPCNRNRRGCRTEFAWKVGERPWSISKTCRNGAVRPSSVVPVTTSYNAKVGLHGTVGTDDEHANIAEASKALTATRLNIGSATDLAAIRNKSGCHWEKGD